MSTIPARRCHRKCWYPRSISRATPPHRHEKNPLAPLKALPRSLYAFFMGAEARPLRDLPQCNVDI